MFKMIIEKSVQFRWAVVFAATLVMAYGLFQLSRLPIDAVPDITNRQVQINTVAPAPPASRRFPRALSRSVWN